MEKGKVKWFNSTKGYGFIQPSSGSTDVFVHISEVEKAGLRTLAEEQSLISAQEDEVAANSYRQLISQRLSENWSRPPSARRGMETLIRLQLVPTGRVVGVTILTSSGDSAFDRSVEQAAFKAAPFVELQQMAPSLFEKKFRQVDVSFSPLDLRL